MSKANAPIFAFNAGEVSSAGLVRVDQERLRLAAEIQENIMPWAVGKGQFRPGTQYIHGTKSHAKARHIPFVKSVSDTALIECTSGYMRVIVSDTLISRPSVTCTVTNGDFSAGASWTLATTGTGTATISGGLLTLGCTARGSAASCKQTVSTSSAGTEHALRIVVTRGPVRFRLGSTDNGDEYIRETALDEGTHSLAFTPTGNFYVKFFTQSQRLCIVDSCTIEAAGTLEITAPWSEADLPLIRHDQSKDIIFLACSSWQQRKIERRATRSWSLVKYVSDDGPFTVARTALVTLTPAATFGNTTLTADGSFFNSNHVGCLFRLFHDRFDATFKLAAGDTWTDPWRVTGIKATNYNDRNFTYQVTGVWVGTARMQRSLDSEDVGYKDWMEDDGASGATFSANQSVTHNDEDDSNNLITYSRVGFLAGDYTSGEMTVAVQHDGHSGYGIGRVTAYNSTTSVDVEVLKDFKNIDATSNWLEGAWSADNLWPSAVAFFDGRLFWAGSDQFWASESDNYYLFNLETDGDSGSIQRDVATGGSVGTVNWMLPLQRLIFGTDASEASARSSSMDEPLTPTACTIKDASNVGVAPVSPVKMDGRGIFVQRSTKKLFELVYNFENNDYTSNDLSVLNEDIGADGFTHLAVQRQPQSYVWAVSGSGEVPVLLYDIKEKVAGWVRFIAGASAAGAATVEDVCVLPGTTEDRVYLTVKRTIGGSTVRFLEKLNLASQAEGGTSNRMADAGVYNAGSVTTFTGLSHLNGETVVAWGNSKPLGSYTVSGGQITLSEAATNVYVGLAYTGRYKSSKLSYAAGGGTALLQKKRVGQLGLLLANTHPDSVTYGANFTTMQKLPRVKGGVAVNSTTDFWTVYEEMAAAFQGMWDTDSRVCLKMTAPYPATLTGMVVSVETNER
jgi:hypothetical protein